jgi:hypothetical protein
VKAVDGYLEVAITGSLGIWIILKAKAKEVAS